MILDILEYRLKSVKTVFVIFVITNYVRIALAIVIFSGIRKTDL